MDKIHHIAIQELNITRGVDSSVNNFDTEILYRGESWDFLKFQNINLDLVLSDQQQPHISFEKKDADKYGELALTELLLHQFILTILLTIKLRY